MGDRNPDGTTDTLAAARNTARVDGADMPILTPSQRQTARKGFKLTEELCGRVCDTPQLGECAEYSSGEEQYLKGDNGVLEKYFPFGAYVAKTEVKSSRPKARVKEVEFIRKYGCSNASNTGCQCMLWTARVPGAILVYERVGEKGIPFNHVHHGIDITSLPVSAAKMELTNSPTRVRQPAALKQPNPSGSPSGIFRRAKNAKRSELCSAGSVADMPPLTKHDDDFAVSSIEVDASAEDKLLQALFNGEFDAHAQQLIITEGTEFDGPYELFSFVLRLYMSDGMLKSNLVKENKGSMTPAELEKAPWGNCVFIDPRDGSKSEIPSRGRLFCNHKDCRWCVPFSYIKKRQVYEIRSGKETNKSYHNHLCLEHNHPPDNEDTCVEGYIEIRNKNDLTVAEMEMLRVCARLNSKMPSIQHALSNAFGKNNKRSYNSDLIRREVDRFKLEMFGTDEHRMKDFVQMGDHVKRNGGWFDFDLSSTMAMTGTRFQTPLMRKYAKHYGGYFSITDGTFGTNKYGLTALPWTGCDCLGLTHCFGISTGLSENSADAIKAGHAFSLSSAVETNEEDEDELAVLSEEIDGVPIENHVLKNSYKGTLFTDDGPFSHPTGVAMGKFLALCTYHKMGDLSIAVTGQSNADECKRDLSALIFRYKSVEELREKFSECRLKYGDKPQANKFIDTLEDKKEKLCLAYTQWIFSFNHTSTQRGEGYNDRLKGHADLKAMLSQADLVTLHDRVKDIEVEVSIKAVKMLMECRRNNKRIAKIYEDAVDESLKMCALYVTSCDKVSGAESKYTVKCRKGPVALVNLDTKIVHRGQIFIIPTCTCGYWCSSFRLCLHIVKALTDDGREILQVKNIHPIHLLQFHPLWPDALRKCRMEDYNDLPQVKLISLEGAMEVNVAASPPASTASVCPSEFFQYTGKKKVPKERKGRASALQQAANMLVKAAVDLGDEHTFQLALARVLQATKECRDMNATTNQAPAYNNDVVPLPPAPRVGSNSSNAKADGVNNSRLSSSAAAAAATTKKKRRPKKKAANPQLHCSNCEVLVQHAKLHVNFNNHSMKNCPNMELFYQYFAGSKDEDGKGGEL